MKWIVRAAVGLNGQPSRKASALEMERAAVDLVTNLDLCSNLELSHDVELSFNAEFSSDFKAGTESDWQIAVACAVHVCPVS